MLISFTHSMFSFLHLEGEGCGGGGEGDGVKLAVGGSDGEFAFCGHSWVRAFDLDVDVGVLAVGHG